MSDDPRQSAVQDFWAETLNGLEHSERYHLSRINHWKAIRAAASATIGIWTSAAIVATTVFDLPLEISDSFEDALEAVAVAFGFVLVGPREGIRRRIDLHNSIREDFLRLQTKMENGRLLEDHAKAELTKECRAEKFRIEQREPDHLRVLQAECINEVTVGHGGNSESDEYIKISVMQRLCKHFFDWRPYTLFSNEAVRAAAAAKIKDASRARRRRRLARAIHRRVQDE